MRFPAGTLGVARATWDNTVHLTPLHEYAHYLTFRDRVITLIKTCEETTATVGEGHCTRLNKLVSGGISRFHNLTGPPIGLIIKSISRDPSHHHHRLLLQLLGAQIGQTAREHTVKQSKRNMDERKSHELRKTIVGRECFTQPPMWKHLLCRSHPSNTTWCLSTYSRVIMSLSYYLTFLVRVRR